MHPAFSVIFFSTATGAGYGLLLCLGLHVLAAPNGLRAPGGAVAAGIALLLVVGGLLSSLGHLGRPERAWRAFSQWRSSWLSREGVAAVITFAPATWLAVLLWQGNAGSALQIAGALSAAGAVLTVYCTARIYTSLSTIHAWHNAWVLPGYLLFALWSGSLWFLAISAAFGIVAPIRALIVTGVLTVAVAALKLGYWRFLARSRHPALPSDALGPGRYSKVRAFEAPHTEENYLTREMGFRLARKHARRLKHICAICIALILGCLLLAGLLPRTQLPWITLATVLACLALLIERWLFFAEAKHVVTLYYGAPSA